MQIAFFGSSILSSYWNGAATYYRGLLRSLAELGYEITFYEPDAHGRQQNRDVESFPWVRSVVYGVDNLTALECCLNEARTAHIIVKASGVGVFDQLLERRVAALSDDAVTLFWDVDAPATLDRVLHDPNDPFRADIPRYHAICTYGGGERVVTTYKGLGAKHCVPVYNAVDTATHFPVERAAHLASTLSFQGNRLPDREARVDEFFFRAARLCPHDTFVLGGSGWGDKSKPANVNYIGHVGTNIHNAFNASARFVLNINRDSMASYGFSPPTRVFEAAAAAACLITDAWQGIETFLTPGREILVANNGEEVADLMRRVSLEAAREIGAAARKRILAEHTYSQRASLVQNLLEELRRESLAAEKVFA